MSESADLGSYAFRVPGPAVEASERWVRVKFGGRFIADSSRPLLLRLYGPKHLPTYYFPAEDVLQDSLVFESDSPTEPGVEMFTVRVGEKSAARAAWRYADPPENLALLKGFFSFKWAKMDAWFEEEEEIFVHARDPHKRVDVIASSRHVRVEIDGISVANTQRPWLLFETGLPTRYYLPRADVSLDLLEASSLRTRCPYKGQAAYWSVRTEKGLVEDIAWSYPNPIPECYKIRDLICFFNEKVDIYVNGQLQERPSTPWS